MRIDWKAGVGLGVSALLLWWVFRGEDLGAIARRLTTADPAMLIVTGAISTSGGLIGALRWQVLLEPLSVSTTLRERWAALNIGFMVTNLFPARLGEIVRPFALSRIAPVSMSGALGTVVLERLLDVVALLILLVVCLLSPAFPTDSTIMGRSLGSAVSGVIFVVVAALAVVGSMIFWPNRVTRLEALGNALPAPLGEGLASRIEEFLSGLELVRRPAALLRALSWSLLLWVWWAAAFWAAFRAFGLELGFTAAVFTQCAVSLFIALPAGPGFIGAMEAGVSVSLHHVFAVPTEQTLSLAVGYHLAGFVPITLLGLHYAWRTGLQVGSIENEAETARGGNLGADT